MLGSNWKSRLVVLEVGIVSGSEWRDKLVVFLREYVYVDIDKVRGLVSQIDEGVPEKVVSTEAKSDTRKSETVTSAELAEIELKKTR